MGERTHHIHKFYPVSRGDYSGMGILGASLGFWTLLKKSGPQLDMIFQTIIFMWVFFFFLNLLIINVLFNTSSFFFFLIDTELCEKQPPVLTLCSNNRKIRGRGFEICWWHWPLLQFYRDPGCLADLQEPERPSS